MKIVAIAVLLSSNFAWSIDYPKVPDVRLTPGSLCDTPTSYRYREQIPYCERDVIHELKDQVFEDYRRLGFSLDMRNRSNYKVDHLIPLCAGGSNHSNNLWPQHISVFTLTDPLEGEGCRKLSEGRITQSKLIGYLLAAKRDHSRVRATLQYFKSL